MSITISSSEFDGDMYSRSKQVLPELLRKIQGQNGNIFKLKSHISDLEIIRLELQRKDF